MIAPERRAKHIDGPQSASAPAHAPGSDRHQRLLFVCTGNICRSPYMELLVADALERAGSQTILVASAGTAALEGHPMSDPLARRLEERDIDASAFQARQLTTAMVVNADLIVTAERAHRRVVARVEPSAAPRTFTLLQLARLMGAVGQLPRSPGVDDGLAALVHQLDLSRGSAGAGSAADDIDDPWGKSRWAYRRAATAIEVGVRPLVKYLVGRD